MSALQKSQRTTCESLLAANYLRFGFLIGRYLRTRLPSAAGNGVPQEPQAARGPEPSIEFSIVSTTKFVPQTMQVNGWFRF